MTSFTTSSTTSDLDNTLDTAHPITTVARVANTTSTNSFTGLTEEWLTIKLTRDEAVLYLIAEILEWFKERGIDVESERARRERDKQGINPAYVPWYLGGFHGVRIDKAIKFHTMFWRENFRSNPYGLNARWYAFILISQLVFLLGNILTGTAEALEKRKNTEKHVWAPILRGAISALPIVWMFTLFLYPPLISNVRDQFTAMGHHYD